MESSTKPVEKSSSALMKKVTEYIAFTGVLFSVVSGILWFGEARIRDYMHEMSGASQLKVHITQLAASVDNLAKRLPNIPEGPVIVFIREGSDVQDGKPGEWVRVDWQFDKKRDDCDRPALFGFIRTADGITSSAKLMFPGVKNPLGPSHLSYLLYIPDDAARGAAQFFVQLDYNCSGNTSTTVTSPRIPFNIK